MESIQAHIMAASIYINIIMAWIYRAKTRGHDYKPIKELNLLHLHVASSPSVVHGPFSFSPSQLLVYFFLIL